MAAITTLLPVFFMLALGQISRRFKWVTPEQKNGANTILFGILFPIMIGLTLVLLFAILYVAPLAQFFQLTGLSAKELMMAMFIAGLSVLWVESYKWAKRRKG